MNNAVLLQNCHGNSDYIHLIELVFSRHARYCKYWKFDYRFEYSDIIEPKPEGGDWGKVKMIQRALEEYEYVVWMDSDAFIWNVATDLRDACVKSCNVVLYDNPFLLPAVGVTYWHNDDSFKAEYIVAEWRDHEPGISPWWEQGEFQNLCVEAWKDYVGELETRWDHTPGITECSSPVVVAFHGYPDVPTRMEHMKRWIDAWTLPTITGVTLPALKIQRKQE